MSTRGGPWRCLLSVLDLRTRLGAETGAETTSTGRLRDVGSIVAGIGCAHAACTIIRLYAAAPN